MGVKLSFPVQRLPITFELEEIYTPCGIKDINRCKRLDVTEFERLTEKHFKHVLSKRKNVTEARKKYQDIDKFLTKFPKWTHHDVFDLRTEFMAFDRNNDGLIDLPEMSKALDELGDSSSAEARHTYFHQMDIDDSDSIDFEEFLDLMRKGSEDSLHQAIGKACSYGRKYGMLKRVMTVEEQIEAELF